MAKWISPHRRHELPMGNLILPVYGNRRAVQVEAERKPRELLLRLRRTATILPWDNSSTLALALKKVSRR